MLRILSAEVHVEFPYQVTLNFHIKSRTDQDVYRDATERQDACKDGIPERYTIFVFLLVLIVLSREVVCPRRVCCLGTFVSFALMSLWSERPFDGEA